MILQVKLFNDLLDQLFEFLEVNFSDFKSDLILTRSAVQFIRRSNPRLVVEQFLKYVKPYSKQIFECNEDFFLDFDNLKSSYDLSSDNILLGMRIKNIWLSNEITDRHKAYIWLYFQKLLKAGEKV